MEMKDESVTLQELIHKNLDVFSNWTRRDVLSFFEKNCQIGEVKIPNNAVSFINKFKQKSVITSEEYLLYRQSIDKINTDARQVLAHLLSILAITIYKNHEADITDSLSHIDNSIKQSLPLPEYDKADDKYFDLINAYRFLLDKPYMFGNFYPGICYGEEQILRKIPFALNIFRLIGKLSKSQILEGLDLSKPFYPLHLKVVNQVKAPPQPGMLQSDVYFPIKFCKKICKGDTGDNTFLVTNGSELLYVRGNENYSPTAVFASKIATLVSEEYFSLECLLDNRLVASPALKSYAFALIDPNVCDQVDNYIGNGLVLPGAGLMDEVTNFICETDPNIENHGLSTQNLQDESCHLSKIDYDRCSFYELTIENYERDRLINGLCRKLPQNEAYINEKLYARLKLSMIPDQLFAALANEAYLHEDIIKIPLKRICWTTKDEIVREACNRKEMAVKLLFEHPEVINWFKKNPDIVNQCGRELENYIDLHFENQEVISLKMALKSSIQSISTYLSKTSLVLNETDRNALSLQSIFYQENAFHFFSDNSQSNELHSRTCEKQFVF